MDSKPVNGHRLMLRFQYNNADNEMDDDAVDLDRLEFEVGSESLQELVEGPAEQIQQWEGGFSCHENVMAGAYGPCRLKLKKLAPTAHGNYSNPGRGTSWKEMIASVDPFTVGGFIHRFCLQKSCTNF